MLAFLANTGLVLLVVTVGCAGSSRNGSGSACPPIAEPPNSWSPAWSPDGRKIAFVSGDSKWNLYVLNADGAAKRQLTSTPTRKGLITAGAWSTDGRRIVFAGKTGIFVMSGDGSNKRQLTRTRQDDYPAWSPDGRKIAFVRGDRIIVMNGNGTDQHGLTSYRGAAYGVGGPTWSPRGQKIAFPAFFPASREDRIVVVNANGTRPHRLTHNRETSETAYEYFPAWSPDGTEIAFGADSGEGGARWIDVINANGNAQRQLTNLKRDGDCENDYEPAWSPSGRKIAFARASQNNDDTRLYVMNADGSNQHPLPHH